MAFTTAEHEYLQLKACFRHPVKCGIPLFGKLYQVWKHRKALRRHQKTGWEHELCVVLCIKNEASYIEEWLEYHLLMGVQHIFIYDNESSDNLKEILSPYREAGLVEYIYWPGRQQQNNIYADAIKRCENYRWAAFIDVDEFIQIRDGRNLHEFLKEYEDCQQVILMYCEFGSSGELTRRPGLLLERFTHSEAGVNLPGKSFVCPCAVILHRIHMAWLVGKSVDEASRPCASFTPAKKTADIARIVHYACRSLEECRDKRKRGDAVYAELAKDYFETHDKNDVEDLSMQVFIPRIYAALAARHKARGEAHA